MLNLTAPGSAPWRDADRYWAHLDDATREWDPPFAVLSQSALAHNAHDLVRRAGGKRIRVASKSVRVRGVLDAVLALPGFGGILAYSLPEALWLAASVDDVVVGYPSVDRAALRRLATDPQLARRVTIMVDSVEQLDAVDAVLPPARREVVRVCLELDASWRSRILGHTGALRSPVHTVAETRALAESIVDRPGFELVGMMAYEGQIAGVVDRPAGRPLWGAVVRWMQGRSAAELAERRAAAVAAVRGIADLEFVNGGGTGSLESTSEESAVTEVAAGSGLFGPHLFDHYTRFQPAPAAAFSLSVVRVPRSGTVTVHGGGWVASGAVGSDRLPLPVWPHGLRMLPREGAGEVQTPLSGATPELGVGSRVWFRHTKAGELSEHVNEFVVVGDEGVAGTLPTYRGEGKVFL